MLILTFCSQRIDMFGAQKADLPSIWAELVEAGFQSGHAYGKSLRTVKSCVGTTWCRYGVGDSVGRELIFPSLSEDISRASSLNFRSHWSRRPAGGALQVRSFAAQDKRWCQWMCSRMRRSTVERLWFDCNRQRVELCVVFVSFFFFA